MGTRAGVLKGWEKKRVKAILNMDEILGELVMLDVNEAISHDDVSAWLAPSECHRDVTRFNDKLRKEKIIEIEGTVNAPLDMILKEAEKRGWNYRLECQAFGRLYQKYNPFN